MFECSLCVAFVARFERLPLNGRQKSIYVILRAYYVRFFVADLSSMSAWLDVRAFVMESLGAHLQFENNGRAQFDEHFNSVLFGKHR